MTRKRKAAVQPKKLPNFFPPSDHGGSKHGAGNLHESPSFSGGSHSAASSPCSLEGSVRQPPCASTPLSCSPAKSKPRLALEAQKVSSGLDSMEDTRELTECINEFPTTDQPLSDTTLKDMLVSLRSSLHTDMMKCML